MCAASVLALASAGAPANDEAIFSKSHSLTILQSKMNEWSCHCPSVQTHRHTLHCTFLCYTLLGQCTFECISEWCYSNEKCIERKSGSASMKVCLLKWLSSLFFGLFPLFNCITVAVLSISNLFKGIPSHLTSIWQLRALAKLRSSIDLLHCWWWWW